MFTWCRKRKADVIFLQETHSTVKTETQWKNEWGAEIITSHGSSNARGVAILSTRAFCLRMREMNGIINNYSLKSSREVAR